MPISMVVGTTEVYFLMNLIGWGGRSPTWAALYSPGSRVNFAKLAADETKKWAKLVYEWHRKRIVLRLQESFVFRPPPHTRSLQLPLLWIRN
jgi:hypothetical protein